MAEKILASGTSILFLMTTPLAMGGAIPTSGTAQDVFSANSGRGALGALEDCRHAAASASVVPQDVERFAPKCEQPSQTGPTTPSVQRKIQACWAFFRTAMAELRAAKALYDQADRTPGPAQVPLNAQAMQHNRQAKKAIDSGDQCTNEASDLFAAQGKGAGAGGDVFSTNPKGGPPDIYGGRTPGRGPGDVYGTNPRGVPSQTPSNSGQQGKCPGYYPELWCNDPKMSPPPGCCDQVPRSAPADGGKNITRERPPQRPLPRDPGDVEKLLAAIDRCLREESQVRYYASPKITRYLGTVALDQQTPYVRTFLVARSFAGYLLNLRQRLYNTNAGKSELDSDSDVIVGFITHCLREYKLLGKEKRDPREQFADFLVRYEGVSSDQAWQRADNDFSVGWGLMYAGLPRDITMEE